MGQPAYDPKAVKHLLKVLDQLWANLADLNMTVDDNGKEYRDMKKVRLAIQRVKNGGHDKQS